MTDLTELQKLYGRVKWEHFLPVLAKFIEPHTVPPSPIEAEEVEAVARALCLHNACQPDDDDEFEGSAMWTNWEDEALAAIQASRGYWEKKR